MPKGKRQAPVALDLPAMLRAATKRPLRPGEAMVLTDTLSAAARKIRNLEATITRLESAHNETIKTDTVGIKLNAAGKIEVIFQDQHSVEIPIGLHQSDFGLAMSVLVRILKSRRDEAQHTVGTSAAPTRYDLTTLVQEQRQSAKVTVCPPAKRSAPDELSLEDLGL